MTLFLLRPVDGSAPPWEGCRDRTYGFVIRAESEDAARRRADAEATDRAWLGRRRPWLDAQLSACKELIAEGDLGVIIEDFSGG